MDIFLYPSDTFYRQNVDYYISYREHFSVGHIFGYKLSIKVSHPLKVPSKVHLII